MDMQNVAKLNIPEGEVRTIHDKDGNLIWGKVSYGVKYKGETSQQTYTGKNLVYTSGKTDGGITATYNAATGETTISGKATNTYAVFGAVTDVLPAGTYTFSIQSAAPCGVGVATKATGGSRTPHVITTGSTKTTFTISADSAQYDIYLTGLTVNTAYSFTFKAMLESGSSATSFEPYVGGVPAPNPDYPQAVKVVTGENVVKITDGQGNEQSYEVNLGKNLFSSRIVRGYYAFANGNYSPDSSSYVTSEDKIPVEAGQTYTISANKGVYDGSDYAGAGVVFFNNGTYVSSILRPANGTFTVPSGANQVIYNFYKGSSDSSITPNDITWVQLELGSTATSYAAYFEPIELCKIGDYQDYIYKSGDKWYVHKEVGKAVLDGSEAWETPNNRSYSLHKANSKISNMSLPLGTLQMLCDYFTPTQSYDAVGSVGTGNSFINFNYDGTSSNLAGFKTWLTNNNVSLYAPLATPTDTEITNATLIAQLEAIEQWLTRYGYNATVSGNLPIIIDRTAL